MLILLNVTVVAAIIATPALSADLKVTFSKLPENASCISTSSSKSVPGPNKSLAVSWSKGPRGTRSYALTMVDPDVPADFSLFNRADKIIPEDFRRMEFVHWVLADIPPSRTNLGEGTDGNGPSANGLPLRR
nr:hypothetical protein [Agrobacterium pusense]